MFSVLNFKSELGIWFFNILSGVRDSKSKKKKNLNSLIPIVTPIENYIQIL